MHDQSPLLPLEHVSAANGRLAVVHRAEHRAQLYQLVIVELGKPGFPTTRRRFLAT